MGSHCRTSGTVCERPPGKPEAGGLFLLCFSDKAAPTANIAVYPRNDHSSFPSASPQKQDKSPKRMTEHQQSKEER